jgi:hypothetical protein
MMLLATPVVAYVFMGQNLQEGQVRLNNGSQEAYRAAVG